MITKLHLKNFKSWEDTGEINLAPITGFFGTNSSGKTSLLQALLMMKQTVESNNRSTVLNFGGSTSSYVNLGTYSDVVYQNDRNRVIHFILEWEKDYWFNLPVTEPNLYAFAKAAAHSDTLKFGLEAAYIDERVTVQRFMYYVNKMGIGVERIDTLAEDLQYRLAAENLNISIDIPLPKPMKSYLFPLELRNVTKLDSEYVLPQIESKFEKIFQASYYLGPLREYPARYYLWRGESPQGVGTRGELTVPALIASQIDEENNGWHQLEFSSDGEIGGQNSVGKNVASWLQKLGLIHSFSLQAVPEIESYKIEAKVTPNSTPVSLSELGFGVSQVLPVLTLCYYAPRGSILIFEQPELHLHPSVQSGLADVFIDVSKNRDIQIIFESHSEHLLHRLQRRVAEEALTPDQVALYFTSIEKGQSQMERLRVDEYGNILNWPENFFGDEMGDLVAMTEAAINRQN